MNRIAFLSGFFVAALTLSAHATDPQIARLRGIYNAAAEKALAPLKANYERELRKILDEQTKAGNMATVSEANIEIEKITGKPAIANGVMPGGIERFFINRTWSTPGGTDWMFIESGKGNRQYHGEKLPFTWRLLKSGLVEIQGQPKGGSPEQTSYFRFVSEAEAYYGLDKDSLTSKLVPKK